MIESVVTRKAIDPEATAIEFGGRRVSYAEFDARVAELARTLIGQGVGPDDAVAVCLPRSVEMMVAVHAIVAAGGQYVPIDTEAPADRAAYMMQTASAQILLTDGAVSDAARAATELGVDVRAVDASGPADPTAKPVTDAERRSPLHGDHALYTLFTSGSTGRPKGVTVSHRAVLNRLKWGLAEYPWGPDDRVIQKTPYTFDVSVPEIFAPLMVGARVILAEPGGHTDPDYIAALIEESGATSVHFVPSMLSAFLDFVPAATLARLTSLRLLFASGEALPAPVVAQARRELPWVSVHNLFGPTEAAVEVAYADVTAVPDVVPIGRPVWNTTLRVLDPRLRTCPAGVPGELYLGGVQLARGYAAQPGLSAERFVADPFGVPGARLYRTGDLVRWSPTGELEYLGRTDFQVKLRGQRIELGEIEAVLAGVPGVVHAAATVATAPGGAQHLVGYLSPATAEIDAARAAAEAALPEYMVPTVWTVLDSVTLNSAGKLDRRALPEPDFSSAEAEYEAPVGDLEEQLAAVVAGLLGIERVSATESFFALGGDSIMSIQLASAMRAAGHGLSPRQIFEHRTVRAMARAIADTDAALPALAEPRGGAAGDVVLPPVVEWMLEYSDTAADFADFNQAATLAAPTGAAVDEVAQALATVVAHHPMLTASLTRGEDGWTLTAGQDFDAAAAITAV
ncbi:amino acid adenylation domain-containing protein, partial [Gordonia sp. (in: high G+C Gram-positive bacteria)]